ncbi:3-isopropylmalate dehydratase large subunit [Deinococcus proteolyticus MRP]|uniref:3-isopropylmalate dehydratase large subunit n=1 Tax=Deinococcus proteolyticus (strain ATCC 35074 / DSM 20540 / JCM 6276 / NBRC 101906 / NCIMB 13154 / VKM Ac-1939 / CCM 2703 / MRP) TaxID=693977 RepID=F0RKN7_DEIPM|nr:MULTISPECIES: 3-isopropylmalate dehydratase large subunit [Deinococcus]ADY25727.1 3-isopropylmalate dehydratase large subunit [Deinococcus proteolyticus MRP]MCY1701851.1 3-isopropylmalate dehydratase large subunit [Deinococcus sp. SL84]
MGMTIAEKILAAHAGKDAVTPGELLECTTDLVLCHEITTPAALRMLEERGMDRVFDPEKIVAVPDHSVPAMNIKAAQMYQKLKSWVHEKGIRHFYDVGRGGIAHVVLENTGLLKPGQTLVSGDSHTCNGGALGAFATGVGSTDLAGAIYAGRVWFKVPETMLIRVTGEAGPGVTPKDIVLEVIRQIGADGANYMVMEWVGDYIDNLDMEGRFTLTNMAIEAGGKTGIVAVDGTTREYLRVRGVEPGEYTEYRSDPDAQYRVVLDIDASQVEPTVAYPHIPSNGRVAGSDAIAVTHAYVGSCTNGRISDLREVARILRGRRVADGVQMTIVPATQAVWKQAAVEGLMEIFVDAGATVSYPSCGACLGMHTGVLGPNDVCISSSNRNFVGRMGDPTAQIYLASPATVAASAVTGMITDPRTMQGAEAAD